MRYFRKMPGKVIDIAALMCYRAAVTHNAGWSSLVARRAHNPKVAGSNPAPATNERELVPGVVRSQFYFLDHLYQPSFACSALCGVWVITAGFQRTGARVSKVFFVKD